MPKRRKKPVPIEDAELQPAPDIINEEEPEEPEGVEKVASAEVEEGAPTDEIPGEATSTDEISNEEAAEVAAEVFGEDIEQEIKSASEELAEVLKKSGRVRLVKGHTLAVRRVNIPIGDTLVNVSYGVVKITQLKDENGAPLMLGSGEAVYLPYFIKGGQRGLKAFFASDEIQVLYRGGHLRIVRAEDLGALKVPDYARKLSSLNKYFGGRENMPLGGVSVLPKKVFGKTPGQEFIDALKEAVDELNKRGISVQSRTPRLR
jgi:hypothetical protein